MNREETPRLLGELAALELPEEGAVHRAARRRAAVGRIRAAIEGEDSRSGRRRWMAILAAAAVAFAVLLMGRAFWGIPMGETPVAGSAERAGSVLSTGTGTELVREGTRLRMVPATALVLRRSDIVQTDAMSEATVATTGGVAVSVHEATRVRVDPSAEDASKEQINLQFGRVDVDVPEDGQKREFCVRTPQAVVTVHGTRFTVEVGRPPGASQLETTVRVTRGKVSVTTDRGKTQLVAGASWTSSAKTAIPVRVVEPEPLAASSASAKPDLSVQPPLPVAEARTSLRAQNGIYARAMRAKQRGDDETVIRELDLLMKRYPDSPLGPDARVERFRALRRLGRDREAAQSARQYLAEDPNGFARDEARDVALEDETDSE